MQDKRNTNQNVSQPDPQLVNTVAAVIQALQNSQNASEPQQGPKLHKPGENQPKTIDLIGLLFHILEKFWIVLLVAVIAAGALYFRAGDPVPVYTATSKLYIVNPANSGIEVKDFQIGNELTMDYQEVFKTWEVHEMVREELNLPYSYSMMQSMLTVDNPEDTHVLYITVRFTDAQMAADIANAYARAAKEFIINTMRTEEPSNFSIALVPGYGHATNRSAELVKGFLLGTVLSIGVLTLLFVLDTRPRTPEDIAASAGIPTLAVLPSTKEMKRIAARKKFLRGKGRGRRS